MFGTEWLELDKDATDWLGSCRDSLLTYFSTECERCTMLVRSQTFSRRNWAKYEQLRRIFIPSSNSTIGTIVAVGALGQQHVTVSPLGSGRGNSRWSMFCLGFQQANETGEGKVHCNAVWIEASKMQLTVFLCLKGLLYDLPLVPNISGKWEHFWCISTCFSQCWCSRLVNL